METTIVEKINGKSADNKSLDFAKLHRDVIRGKSNGKIIWQPRIGCWYEDRKFRNEDLQQPYTGMDIHQLYRELGCSDRLYNYFNPCFVKIHDPRVKEYSAKLSDMETEFVMETPIGRISQIIRANNSNYGTFPKKMVDYM